MLWTSDLFDFGESFVELLLALADEVSDDGFYGSNAGVLSDVLEEVPVVESGACQNHGQREEQKKPTSSAPLQKPGNTPKTGDDGLPERHDTATHSPSLAVLPFLSITHSSKKRIMMGSSVDKGVDLNLLLEKISETLARAAAGWLTASSSSERYTMRRRWRFV